MAKKMKWWQTTAYILGSVGALNWGLTELGFNLVNVIFGSITWLESLIYYVVGASGAYSLFALFKK